MTGNLTESRVVEIWKECTDKTGLETDENGLIKVLYPGRINDSSGADFRDAVIQTDHGLLTGDIEIHTRSSLWWAHRHHLDPLYNRVILHVVLQHDVKKSVELENGSSVPTLALDNLFTQRSDHYLPSISPMPCQGSGKKRDSAEFLETLDNAGEQRFKASAAGFQTISSPGEAGQALYRGIMAALGYAPNKHPMTELACRMPLRRLESMVTPQMPDIECLARYQAMLLGMAGLLPSQRDQRQKDDKSSPWVDGLERLWAAAGEGGAMSGKDWQFFRVRPGNFPTRRIAAMSRLLLRYRQEGLLIGLIRKLETMSSDGNHRELEEALIIEAGEEHPDCGGRAGQRDSALLGSGRAADIVINALLPFAAAWGRVNSQPELTEKAAGLYRLYPAPATNTLERHMSRQLGISRNTVNTARRQQGLIHIFKTGCSVGGCQSCLLNRA